MENLSDQEVIEIPEDECAISLDGDGYKEGDGEDLTNVEASANMEVEEEDTDKNEKPDKPEVPERRDTSERKDEKRSSTATDDFADEELDSDVEDTGEGAEDQEIEMMNMPSLQAVMSDLGHLKQGRRVMVHPLRVPELSNPNVLETIQQESCEEIKLHFVRPQGNPEDWSGFLLMHFCSTKAAKQAVENMKAVRDDLTVKSEEGAAYANRTMEQWIKDEKGQKRWTDTLLWVKNIAEDVTDEQLKDVFPDAEDVVMRPDKDKDKRRDDKKKTKEAYVVYRTKDIAMSAAREYGSQTIELDGEVLKVFKYHVPQDQPPRGLLKLKERRLVLKYMSLLTNKIEMESEDSEEKIPDWCSKRLEQCKTLIERDDRARRQLGLPTPALEELRGLTGVKVLIGVDRRETLIRLGVLERPHRSYQQRDSRDFNRDSRDRKRSYDSRNMPRGSNRNSNSSLLGIPPSLTSLNAIPSMAMLMQQNLMGNSLNNMVLQQRAAMMGIGGFGAGMGQVSGMEQQRKMLRLDESGSFHVDYDRSRKGRDSKGGSSRGSKPTSLLDL